MDFPTNMTTFSAAMSTFNQKRTTQVISVTLLIYIAYIFAKMTWLSVPEPDQKDQMRTNSPHKSVSLTSVKNVNLTQLQSLNLFGLYTSEVQEDTVLIAHDAPETRLNLVLTGLVATDDVNIAAAIIEHQGKQETYGISDVIVGTRASLEKVLRDRVLIKQAGRLETLMLDGFDFKKPARAISSKNQQATNILRRNSQAIATETNSLDHRANKKLTASARNLRADVSQDPSKISDYLRILPKRRQGKIIGYSLRPGKKAEFFKLSGLKSGDVAVQMNGFDLTDASDAAKALAEMKQAKDVSLLVQRSGNVMEILFSIE